MLKFSFRLCALILCLILSAALCACAGDPVQSSDASSSVTGNAQEAYPFTPKLIQTAYQTLDSVVAVTDVVAYGADPTGKADSTKAIRDALNAVGQAGGGTVWMPKGQYVVTGQITVPTLVTLRGDWNDPDAEGFNGDYGTVILAKVQSDPSTSYGLFQIRGSAGVEGLTIYYPEQDINNVKPYPYTFYIPRVTLATVKNCTLINAYRGVGFPGNDKCTIKNLKGTCLMEGVNAIISTDIGYFDNITLSPKYWANASASAGMQAADAKEIAKWSKSNKGIGFTLQDLEQSQFTTIRIEGFDHGIHVPCKPSRFMGSGPMFDVTIKNCNYGIYAESGTYKSTHNYATDNCPILTGIDWRCGWAITKGYIEGSKYAVYNGSETVGPFENGLFSGEESRTGYVRLSGVTLKGATKGSVYYTQNGKDDLSGYEIQTNRQVKSTGKAFEYLTPKASEADIQAALDKVGKAGGGVVFLTPGRYEIKNGFKVPANTELRGAGSSPYILASAGTVFWVRQSGAETQEDGAKLPAIVALNGQNAGVAGIYFMYDENIISLDADMKYQFYNYTITGNAKGVWALNLCVMGPTHGIRFENCDDHVIENVYSSCVEESITIVNSNNGLILDCLGNGVYMYCTNVLNVMRGGRGQQRYLDNVGKFKNDYIVVEGGNAQQIVNSFVFCGKVFLTTRNAENLLAVNACSDGLGSVYSEYNGGSVTVLGATQTNGNKIRNNNCKLTVYNNMSLFPQDDKDVKP